MLIVSPALIGIIVVVFFIVQYVLYITRQLAIDTAIMTGVASVAVTVGCRHRRRRFFFLGPLRSGRGGSRLTAATALPLHLGSAGCSSSYSITTIMILM